MNTQNTINLTPKNFNPDNHVLVEIPFPGFYETLLGEGLNNLVEHKAQEPDELGFDFSEAPDNQPWLEWCDDLYKVYDCAFDWKQYQKNASLKYLDSFVDWIRGFTDDIELFALIPESIHSPQYYNYSTDRLFAFMPIEQARVLCSIAFDPSRARDCLVEVLENRFTARSGFIPGYSNKIEDWKSVPFDELDYNHWGAILDAFITYNGEDSNDFIHDNVYYTLSPYEIAYECLDYEKLEKGMNELKQKYKDYVIAKEGG